jgi:hypothetical protein
MPPHPNNFIMNRDCFFRLGGYREDLVDRPYPNKGDTYWKRTWAEARERGEVTINEDRTTLFMFPNGQFCGDVDYNPCARIEVLEKLRTCVKCKMGLGYHDVDEFYKD